MAINSYLKFIKSVGELNVDISPTGKLIMREILKRYDGSSCRVQDIISMKEIASQATLHKNLKDLIINGYLRMQVDISDHRVKNVLVTKKTTSLIQKISNLIEKSIQ